MNAVKENVFSSEAKEGERMKGICKTDNALYVGQFLDGTTVSIGLNQQQRWQFETTSDGRVKLTFRNIGIFVSEKQFFADWKIVEKADG